MSVRQKIPLVIGRLALTTRCQPRSKRALLGSLLSIFFAIASVAQAGTGSLSDNSVGPVSADLSVQGSTFSSICREVRSVPITVTEPLPNYLEVDKVRRIGLRRAGQLAIEHVIGLNLSASSETRLTLQNEVTNNRFYSEKSASSGGLIRYKLNGESVVDKSGHELLKLDLLVTVCVPKTKEELATEKAQAQRRKHPPKLITTETPQFFNPATGEPAVWFWKSQNGEIKLYDNAGFQPETGDKLHPVTKEIARDWLGMAKSRTQAEQENRKNGTRCDQLAANPDDVQKPQGVVGIRYSILKLNAGEAIAACSLAMKADPNTPRYVYQLGRAWQTTDSRKARKYLELAANVGYKAAFDNLGWLLMKQNNSRGGRAMFAQGVSMADPSSMFSLGGMLEQDFRNQGIQQIEDQAISLYQRAASLGHFGAKRHLAQIQLDQQQATRDAVTAAEQKSLKQQQGAAAAQVFLGILGAVIRSQN